MIALILALHLNICAAAVNNVISLNIETTPEKIIITPQLNFKTSPKIKEAIDHGIRIQLIAKAQYYHPRSWWFDNIYESEKITLEIYFFTMGKLYVVKNKQSGEQLSFNDFDQLLQEFNQLIEFDFVPVADKSNDLWVGVRVMLDKSALPTAMQLPVLFDSEWDINTDWFQQKVNGIE